ncbi:MAG TPA: MXAN_5187 C-terminal domain-containing protein [Methylomirabilota bacterium]|nr:MXAN_5187 C-terminal domain-containing protein [Methylomirabilota bacterium]
MGTIEEDLAQLERDIRQFKIEYEQYFGGGRKRPPTEIEWRIEQTMKRHSERAAQLRFNQNFRLSNLQQTFAKYKEMFRKRTQQKEEGAVQRHFGAAAKAIEAERLHQQPAEPAKAAKPGDFRVTCVKPDEEAEKVEQLYQAFVKAKEQVGERTDKLSRANFREFVRKKTKELQSQQDAKEVEYVVEVAEGQAKLKARVKS